MAALIYEAFGRVRLLLEFIKNHFADTSGLAGEGKSITILNLAISFAEAGSKVLLIDADLRRPTMAKLMIEKASLGLSDGTDFGEEGTGFMRMNIATPRKNVERALMQLKRAVCEVNK